MEKEEFGGNIFCLYPVENVEFGGIRIDARQLGQEIFSRSLKTVLVYKGLSKTTFFSVWSHFK